MNLKKTATVAVAIAGITSSMFFTTMTVNANGYSELKKTECNNTVEGKTYYISSDMVSIGLELAEEFKKENPNATIEEINSYLEGKGVEYRKPSRRSKRYSGVVMSEAEAELFQQNRYYAIKCLDSAATALGETTRYYVTDYNVVVGGNGDAFRHGFWVALMAHNTNPSWAKKWAEAHETSDIGTQLEGEMDLYNNKVGLKIYNKIKGELNNPRMVTDILGVEIRKNVRKGKFKIIKGKRLVRSGRAGER